MILIEREQYLPIQNDEVLLKCDRIIEHKGRIRIRTNFWFLFVFQNKPN